MLALLQDGAAHSGKPVGRSARQRGFTLVELMIGVLIGAFSMLVIARVLAFSEGQRRSTTTGSDAQVNGALALYSIQRDAQMAGYGLVHSLDALGCKVKARYNGVDYPWTLAPVTITDGAGSAPDSINFKASATNRYTAPVRVIVNHQPTEVNFSVNSMLGIAEGDLMVAIPPTIDINNWCSVFNVTGLGSGAGQGQGGAQGQNQVRHDPGASGPWNEGSNPIFPRPSGYPPGSLLLNLGSMIDRTYSISANNALQIATFRTATAITTTEEIFPNIVQLQAYYGKDTNGDGMVDTYDATTPTTNAGWRQVLAVRIALVARGTQFEKELVTSADLLWDVGTAVNFSPVAPTCGASRCITLTISHLPDWQRYRYKVYDVVVPIRNMLWGG